MRGWEVGKAGAWRLVRPRLREEGNRNDKRDPAVGGGARSHAIYGSRIPFSRWDGVNRGRMAGKTLQKREPMVGDSQQEYLMPTLSAFPQENIENPSEAQAEYIIQAVEQGGGQVGSGAWAERSENKTRGSAFHGVFTLWGMANIA